MTTDLKFNESEKPRVEVSCEEWEKGEENDYLFMVKDNGIGIEEEYISIVPNTFVFVYRLDLLVKEAVIVEVKAVDR